MRAILEHRTSRRPSKFSSRATRAERGRQRRDADRRGKGRIRDATRLKSDRGNLFGALRGPGWAACLAGAFLAACGGEGDSEPDFGHLLKAPEKVPEPIDLELAAKSPDELLRAAKLQHREVGELLGAHRYAATSSVRVSEDDETIEEIEDAIRIHLDADGDFHAILENSHDYGREAYFSGGELYLRPRYGKYHRRPPESPEEPAEIRDEIYGTLGAYFELLAPRAEVSDGGTMKVGGRSAKKIVIGEAPEARERPEETLVQREWRERAVVRAVSGYIALDRETGAPLRADVEGAVGFKRDGRSFVVHLAVSQEITSVGSVSEVKPPAAKETTTTPLRATEVEERRELLEGLAPPPRRAPTPETVDTRAGGAR